MSFDSQEHQCLELGQAAAYTLRALDEEEAARYRDHLHDCAVCAAEVARLQPVVDSLPGSPPPVSASPVLRARVMASVRSEAELLNAAGAAADRPAPARPRRRVPRLELVAAALALGVGLLIGAVAIGSKGPTRHVTSALASAPPGAHAVLVRQVGGRAELVMSGVPQPPRGKIYEVWLAGVGSSPRATNALFGVTRGGSASVSVPGDLKGVRRVMVTAEPLGGSAHPTSTPIIVATLPS